jgi:signal peptidase I
MKKTYVFAILIALILFTSCSIADRISGKDNEDLNAYVDLQETLVDREEMQQGILMEGIEWKKEADSLQGELQSLASEIEKKKPRSEFVEETPEKPAQELPNPRERVQQAQIQVNENNVVLNVKNVYWGYMIESNSMDPLLDNGTTILTVKPQSEKDIQIGDIIVFKTNLTEYNVVHRVVDINVDADGLYYLTKGDNNPEADPLKVRFQQIISIVIGILY